MTTAAKPLTETVLKQVNKIREILDLDNLETLVKGQPSTDRCVVLNSMFSPWHLRQLTFYEYRRIKTYFESLPQFEHNPAKWHNCYGKMLMPYDSGILIFPRDLDQFMYDFDDHKYPELEV